jgi:hypothetical protein
MITGDEETQKVDSEFSVLASRHFPSFFISCKLTALAILKRFSSASSDLRPKVVFSVLEEGERQGEGIILCSSSTSTNRLLSLILTVPSTNHHSGARR